MQVSAVVLVSLARMGRLCSMREMTGSLEQLAGLEEKEEEESVSSVHGSETCLREY